MQLNSLVQSVVGVEYLPEYFYALVLVGLLTSGRKKKEKKEKKMNINRN